MEKVPSVICIRRRLRSACIFAQFDKKLFTGRILDRQGCKFLHAYNADPDQTMWMLFQSFLDGWHLTNSLWSCLSWPCCGFLEFKLQIATVLFTWFHHSGFDNVFHCDVIQMR